MFFLFQLNAPLFITWFQCAVTVIICAMLGTGAKFFPRNIKFPAFHIDLSVAKQVRMISMNDIRLSILRRSRCHQSSKARFWFTTRIGRNIDARCTNECYYKMINFDKFCRKLWQMQGNVSHSFILVC